MVQCLEPGHYRVGEWGMRIEDMIMVQYHDTLKDMYKFENLTVHPYCRELIDLSLLKNDEIKYLNEFH